MTTFGKIIVIEGLDKVGKSTFCSKFKLNFDNLTKSKNNQILNMVMFPTNNLPIGIKIRNELKNDFPNKDFLTPSYFLADISHFWMNEILNVMNENNTNQSNKIFKKANSTIYYNYLIDRYFISTLAYQAFYENNLTNLIFIKDALNNNRFIKIPSDIIFLDIPNDIIIERIKKDQEKNLNDSNDTTDIEILNKRRDAYKKALDYINEMGINIHFIENAHNYDYDELSTMLIGKIF
jgi:thymidylate kinase